MRAQMRASVRAQMRLPMEIPDIRDPLSSGGGGGIEDIAKWVLLR